MTRRALGISLSGNTADQAPETLVEVTNGCGILTRPVASGLSDGDVDTLDTCVGSALVVSDGVSVELERVSGLIDARKVADGDVAV